MVSYSIIAVTRSVAMLISFGARNYMSFKEGFEVSMQLPASIFKENEVSSALCIIGANASGKTNVIRALSFISQFCYNSFSLKPEDPLSVSSYGFCKEPSSFFLEFVIGGIRYNYSAELTNSRVVSECLQRKTSKWVSVFKRDHNELIQCIKEFDALNKIKLRKNASIISIAHQYEIEVLEEIYIFFTDIESNIDTISGDTMFNGLPRGLAAISRWYEFAPEELVFTKRKLCEADTGISDIRLEATKGANEEEYFFPVFIHESKNGPMAIPYTHESSGTRLLYTQLALFKQVLDRGGVLLLDEFDNNLHPDLLYWLISFFLDPEHNPHNAQIIFSSHNTNIMDLMTKYRVVVVNKEENESFLYRLDELQGSLLRNDRSIEAIYKSGKIGGTPSL